MRSRTQKTALIKAPDEVSDESDKRPSSQVLAAAQPHDSEEFSCDGDDTILESGISPAAPCTLSPARRPDHPRLESSLAGSVCPKCVEETALYCPHCTVCSECCQCVNSQAAAPCDRWFHTNNFHTRHHDSYRRKLFCPRGGDNSGAHNACRHLGDSRRTVGIYEDGSTFIHEDNWRSPKLKAFKPKMKWRGTTTFKTKLASRDNEHHSTNPKVPRNNRVEGSNSPHRRNLAPLLHRLVKSKLYSRQRHSGRKTVIELCCGNDSRLGCEEFVGRNTKVVRITEQDDFTSQKGLQKKSKKQE